MEVKYQNGCMFNDLTIDGINADKLEAPILRYVIKRLIESTDNIDDLKDIISGFLQTHGKYNHLYTCGCCEDHVGEYTMELHKKDKEFYDKEVQTMLHIMTKAGFGQKRADKWFPTNMISNEIQ